MTHLQHVAEDAQDTVELLVVCLLLSVFGVGAPGDAGHHLGNDDEVDDQRGRQEGVLADVEQPDIRQY